MKEIIEELVELIESAIKAKDWKVDGACDPTMALVRAKKFVQDEKCRIALDRLADSYKPKREWVGLTDEEIQEIALEVPIDAVRITEAKLKEKNA